MDVNQHYPASHGIIVNQHNELGRGNPIWYFHGDLVLLSCEENCTDTIIIYPKATYRRGTWNTWISYYRALFIKRNEVLPIFNKTSSKFFRITIHKGQWSSPSTGGMAIRRLCTADC